MNDSNRWCLNWHKQNCRENTRSAWRRHRHSQRKSSLV